MLFWFRAHASRIATTAIVSLATLGASAIFAQVMSKCSLDGVSGALLMAAT